MQIFYENNNFHQQVNRMKKKILKYKPLLISIVL